MKKKYLLISAALCLLGPVLLKVDSYFPHIPEYMMALLTGLMIGAAVLFFLKSGGGILSKILVTVYTVLFAVVTIQGVYCNPYWNTYMNTEMEYVDILGQTLSYREAEKDIDYLMHYLKKDHPMFIDGVPDDVQQACEKAVQELKDEETITGIMLYRKVQNIVSVLGDAHTSGGVTQKMRHYLKDMHQKEKDGYQITAVNGIGLKELFREKEDLYCYETESRALSRMATDLITLEGLEFLDIDPDQVRYTFRNDTGEEKEAVYGTADFIPYEEYEAADVSDQDADEKPFVSYRIDVPGSLAILTLNECKNSEEYRTCLQEMFTEVKAENIRNVAVDLRENGGGNSMVANEFIRYLDVDTYKTGTHSWRRGPFTVGGGDGVCQNNIHSDLVFDGEVFVLTSADTFSSAMLFSEFIKDNHLGRIIGQPPGNAPSGYGEIAIFQLPNSKLYVQISTKKFMRADEKTEDKLVTPDILCDADKALETLYGEIGVPFG